MKNPFSFACGALALLCAACLPAQAASSQSCEALARLTLPEVVRISANDVPAGPFTSPGETKPISGGDLPAFCRVQLTVAPQINIEVWLPKNSWNERYRGEGGGYYVGVINYYGVANALRAGYATASTDTGHTYTDADRANFGARVGAFGLNPDRSLNLPLIRDFAFRSQHEMVLKAKSLIKAYYGKAPRYSYWHGYSSGGREGLTAVQRFPEEYDGVLAGCPAINWDRFMPAGLWPQTVMRQEVGHPIDEAKLEAAASAAIAACDKKDGVVDGIINDPRKCHYDPSALVCRANDKSIPTCLTPQEATAIRKIWEGPTGKHGERVWFGLERGASLKTLTSRLDWLGNFPHGVAHFQWIKQDLGFDWQTLTEADYEPNLRISHEKFGEIVGTDRADLRRFRERGGKVLVLHGESDEIIFPRGAINYFERVLAENGGIQRVNEFARLFMIPGAGHGITGVSDKFPLPKDPFEDLVRWVENGVAPDRIIATQQLPGGRERTRPLCAYPKTAQWTGKGSSDDAANFVCVDGEHDKRDFSVKDLSK